MDTVLYNFSVVKVGRHNLDNRTAGWPVARRFFEVWNFQWQNFEFAEFQKSAISSDLF